MFALHTVCNGTHRKRYEAIITRHPKCNKTGFTSRWIERIRERVRESSLLDIRKAMGIMVFVLAVLTIAGTVAPRSIAFAQRLEFDVASIKQNLIDGPPGFKPQRSGGLVTMHNAQLSAVFYYAYNLTGDYQVVGFPRQFDWYDIDARTNDNATEEQIRLMFQSLLEDRFKLKVHRETRDVTAYELMISNGKSKLTPAHDGEMPATIEGRTFNVHPGLCMTTLWREGAHFTCHAATMDKIVAELSGLLHAPVVDRTRLTGTYDVNLLFLPNDRVLQPDAPPAPTLEEAIRQELGFTLKKGKTPTEVIVVDHLEKPSAN